MPDTHTSERRSEISVVVESTARDNCALTHQIVRGWDLVIVRGELTPASAPVLTSMLDSILDGGGQRVIVDIARASTIAAAAIQPLARVDVELKARGGELRLVVDGVAALHAIREAGLSGRFEIHRYVGDIVGAVAGLDEGGRGKRRGSLTV